MSAATNAMLSSTYWAWDGRTSVKPAARNMSMQGRIMPIPRATHHERIRCIVTSPPTLGDAGLLQRLSPAPVEIDCHDENHAHDNQLIKRLDADDDEPGAQDNRNQGPDH